MLAVPLRTAFEVITQVELYPEFLPACESVEVIAYTEEGLVARVNVAGMGMRESFVTNNTHIDDTSVIMRLEEGPFEHLYGEWTFKTLGDTGCRIDLVLDYHMRGLLGRMLLPIVDKIADKLVDAFCARVEVVHGRNR
jgi:ribosome-associated toxin RatA of RatAB toxin-antitoxin module